MNLPAFLGPLTPVPAALVPLGLEAADAGTRSHLTFTMQRQDGFNWCWAAAATSVSLFYDPQSPWRQCSVAKACLHQECCVDKGPCDIPHLLERALGRTGNMSGGVMQGVLRPADLVRELEDGRLVGCRIAWDGNQGGHFVVIYGYDAASTDVDIGDSLFGDKTLPYTEFATNYKGRGRWDLTYHTEAAP